jgi:hypothetical protein
MYYVPKSPDSSFSIGYVLNTAESDLSIVAASGPALWPLARRWFPHLFSNLALSRGYQGQLPDIELTVDTRDNASSWMGLVGGNRNKTKPAGRKVLRMFFPSANNDCQRDDMQHNSQPGSPRSSQPCLAKVRSNSTAGFPSSPELAVTRDGARWPSRSGEDIERLRAEPKSNSDAGNFI